MKKEDINYVFEENSELNKIGTKEQYSKYLKTIFPESKVKDIVYHGTTSDFEEFDKNKLGTSTKNITNKLGFYFVPDKRVANIFIKGKKFSMKSGKLKTTYPGGAKIYSALLNMKNPEKIEGDLFQKYAEENKELPPLDLKGDSIIISPQTDNILPEFSVNNYVAFKSEQIHILGSKKDFKGFEDYVKNKSKEKSKGNSLENKLISGIFLLSFLVGLFLIPFNLTGNFIGTSRTANRLFGIILILLGVGGFFVYRELSKD